MTERILSLRELNRATLSRQLLLDRANVSIPAAVERLIGMQSQSLPAPFIGLWTRLPNFQREHLAQVIDDHTIIKATTMRATLHLMTAADYLRFRTTLQPALNSASESISKTRGAVFDIEQALTVAREFLSEKPRTFVEISDRLTEVMPDSDVGAMRYTVRLYLPLVQVPIKTGWSYSGTPEFTLAESWLGQAIDPEDHLRELVFRYLAAFGPATVKDMETWSYLPKLKDTFEKLRPELVVYWDEKKRELFDVPYLSIPDADTPVPIHFLPEYDNILLSHDKRTRVLDDGHRKQVYLPGLRVASTILVDGFVAGAWKIEKVKKSATLVITPFGTLSAQDRAALTEEGERLVRFVEAEAKEYTVKFAE